MRVLVAPDKFKESLSSLEVARAVERGVKKANPHAEVILCPLADGGEGTVEALVTATNGKIVRKRVTGPLGRPVDAFFGLLGSVAHPTSDIRHPAVVEMSAASGLHLVPFDMRNPMITTTFGTGELIKEALDKGCKKIIIGIGGSATTDGGMGMAQALGARFLDKQGKELGLGSGQELIKIDKIDVKGLDGRITQTQFLVASDVQNPLTGPDGAAYVYAPQKGASPEMVVSLDQGLSHYAEVIKRDLGIGIKDVPGSGAAGGLGAGLMVFLDAKLKSGVDLIMEAVGFEEKLQRVDLIITGEGKIDAQTAYGKVPVGVAKLAQTKGIPVIAIGGQVTPDAEILKDYGLAKMYSLVKAGINVEEAIKNARELIEQIAEQVIRIWSTNHELRTKN